MTTTMSEPTLPVVSFLYAGFETNEMHGYVNPVDTGYFNEHISPLLPGRKASVKIDTFGTSIDKLRFEVRSTDGERLIENTDIFNYLTNGNEITADIVLKDLYEKDTEYSLALILTTGSGREIYYYSRIIMSDNYPIRDMLEFANYFTKTSYNRVDAMNELATYMESNSKGDNSSFHKVDIHSSMNQLTWNQLDAEMCTDQVLTIKEMDTELAVIKSDYYITINQDDRDIYYKVCDKYRLKLGSERMYLLDFQRETNQIFSLDTATMANNKIVLGIADDNVNMVESPDGNQLAFVSAGRLYSYNNTDNRLASIFGFYEDGNETDKRKAYDNNDITIFSIDETGNVYFMLYGYMNRGIHEGEMGIAIYFYDSIINNVEEKIFIPYDKSYAALKNEVDMLSFVNQNDKGYVFVNDSVYRISLETASSELIVQNIPFGGLVVSDDNQMAAWISGGDIYNASQAVMLNMVTGEQTYIQAGDDKRIWVLGFFGEDLIYGIADKKDIYTDEAGNILFPMNTIYIRDERGNILKEYHEEGYYITDTETDENMLTLTRVRKEDEGYVITTPDQILNNKTGVSRKNTVETVLTEKYETIVEIALRSEIDRDTLQILTPRLVLFEGDRTIKIQKSEDYNCFYAYVMGDLVMVTDNESEAVDFCYENSGEVLNWQGKVVYRKETYINKNQIMAIREDSMTGAVNKDVSSLVCLDTLLTYEGKSTNAKKQLNEGKSTSEIIRENIDACTVINLTESSVGTYQYYLKKDLPVYVKLKDSSTYLIIGYNEYNYVFFDPQKASIYKVGKEDTATLIEGNAIEVITYIK